MGQPLKERKLQQPRPLGHSLRCQSTCQCQTLSASPRRRRPSHALRSAGSNAVKHMSWDVLRYAVAEGTQKPTHPWPTVGMNPSFRKDVRPNDFGKFRTHASAHMFLVVRKYAADRDDLSARRLQYPTPSCVPTQSSMVATSASCYS